MIITNGELLLKELGTNKKKKRIDKENASSEILDKQER